MIIVERRPQGFLEPTWELRCGEILMSLHYTLLGARWEAARFSGPPPAVRRVKGRRRVHRLW